MTQTAETEGTLSVLMQKIERLEDTAKRSIELSLGSVSEIPKEKIISPEQCEWTLKNCAIFRHWINDLDPGTVGLRQSLDGR
ncbi:hypothetical protein HA727_001957 [Salmonella enterica]|nr:hypothetical protein [Salmonella enterica]EIW3594475.1 hypothetical protein [Salmonella enterica]